MRSLKIAAAKWFVIGAGAMLAIANSVVAFADNTSYP